MDYQVSARKYRPGTFDDVIGQPHVVQTLVNSITTKRIAQAYLFSGTRGVGKTTVARILAKALNCEQGPTGTPCGDLRQLPGNCTGDIRRCDRDRRRVQYERGRRARDPRKRQVHRLSRARTASTSSTKSTCCRIRPSTRCLKTLEEPPPHVVFIFATTEIHKIPATILSRCQHYNFRRIAKTEIIERLRHVAEQDGIAIEERSLMALARASEGSMRDASEPARPGRRVWRQVDRACGPRSSAGRGATGAAASHDPGDYWRRTVQRRFACWHSCWTRDTTCGPTVPTSSSICATCWWSRLPHAQEWPGLIEASADDLVAIAADKGSLTPEHIQELFALFTQAEDALTLQRPSPVCPGNSSGQGHAAAAAKECGSS